MPEAGSLREALWSDETAETDASALGLAPLRTSSLVDEIANQLYSAIVKGNVKPGQRLSEAAIARSLGVSRGPIREAQRLLERRGLLVFRPRRGFFVQQMSVREVEDLFGLRERLECYSVALAIERATDEDLEDLDRQLRGLRSAGNGGGQSGSDPSLLVEADLALHRAICRLSGNASLIAIYEPVVNELRLALSMINMRFGEPVRIVTSHAALVEAMVRRDAVTAVDEMKKHLAFSRRSLLRRLAEQAAEAATDA